MMRYGEMSSPAIPARQLTAFNDNVDDEAVTRGH